MRYRQRELALDERGMIEQAVSYRCEGCGYSGCVRVGLGVSVQVLREELERDHRAASPECSDARITVAIEP